MAEIHIDPIPINPAKDRWGARRNAEIQELEAGHNDHDAKIELLEPIPGRVDAVEAEVEGLIEGVIPDLTDAGMAAVARSGGEFTEELTAQTTGLIADSVAYVIDYGTDLSTPRLDAMGSPIAGRVIWQGISGVPVNRIPGDAVLIQAVREAPTWTPASLPNLLAWFDAQSLAVADGTLLASWTDRSANAYVAAAGAAGTLPAYNAAGIKGLPSVRFDGSNDYMQFTFPEHNGLPWTAYCVALSLPAAPTGDDSFFGGGNAASAGRLILERRSTNAIRAGSGASSITSADGIGNNAAHLYKLVQSGTSSLIAIDGSTVATGTLTTSAVATDRIRLGGRVDGTNFFDGHLGEVIFVKGTVSPADDALVTAYLNNRWWLT